jgi:hypothetical protein
MEDKGQAPTDQAAEVQESLGQPQTGVFARIKSMAVQNSFFTGAVMHLTQAERERAEVAEAERDRAIEAAARFRYERDETRAIACLFLAAIIYSGSLTQWMVWICTLVSVFGATRVGALVKKCRADASTANKNGQTPVLIASETVKECAADDASNASTVYAPSPYAIGMA